MFNLSEDAWVVILVTTVLCVATVVISKMTDINGVVVLVALVAGALWANGRVDRL